jgi:uncharacterized membrane protein YkvI
VPSHQSYRPNVGHTLSYMDKRGDGMRKTARVLQVALTYIGTVVGAGFASGQEILQFFTKYGWMATFTIMLAAFLFIWLGTKVMLLANETNAQSYEDLNKHLFGDKVGEWISLFILAVLFGVNAIMLAGAGTLFAEQLHLTFETGVLLTLAVSYIVLTRGLQGILTVNSVVVPVMLVFTAVVVYAAWHTPNAGNWLRLTGEYSLPRIWISPFLYTAFNLAMSQAVLVPLGSAIKDRSILYWGGLLGGAGIGIMLLSAHFSLSAHMPGITQFEIPMGQVVDALGSLLAFLYVIVIYGEIFTTFVSGVYGLTTQLEQRTGLSQQKIIIWVLLLSYPVSHLGFSRLLSALYPLFGFVSLFWLAMLVARRSGGSLPRS